MVNRFNIWWRQAQADFKTADDDFNAGNFYATTLFCQQAAEKALKAVVAKGGKVPPRTHNLLDLGVLANAIVLKQYLALLNPWYTISRYPDVGDQPPVDMVKKHDAEKSLKAAKEVLEWIKKLLDT